METGGITPVEGAANNLHIVALAEFAVEEHNKEENAALKFEKVVSAEEQVVAGTMYYVTLVANDGGDFKVYEAKIWAKPWENNFKKLTEFNFLGDAHAN